VVINEENHSFDNLLGRFCYRVANHGIVRPGYGSRCAGTIFGRMPNGARPELGETADFGLNISHTVAAQILEMDGGKMDGWTRVVDCGSRTKYACMTAFSAVHGRCGSDQTETCIPNIVRWATQYTVADHTFEFVRGSSWAGHMILASATLDRFSGENPKKLPDRPGWGCDSGDVAPWRDGPTLVDAPSCVPDASGDLGPMWNGYSGPRADYVPTIFDTLDQAGVSWRLYGGDGETGDGSGYIWAMCPTFYECLGSSQATHMSTADQVLTDAQGGVLPAVSFVTPYQSVSTHEPVSTADGDNWLGTIIGGIMKSPEWGSTAIFLTWDDCGCFYDHMNPLAYNPHFGVRLPMMIISPYAKQGYTDATPTSVVGILSFIEHTFGLPPLNPCAFNTQKKCTDDANTYDFSRSFDFSQAPLPAVSAVWTRLARGERAWLRAHPDAANEGT
jgi:phospholipase C